MKRHVLSPKYLSYMDYAVFMLKSSAVKVVFAAFIFYAIRIYYLNRAIEKFRYEFPTDYANFFKAEEGADLFFRKEIK